MGLTVEDPEQDELLPGPVVETRILEILRNTGGHGRLSQIAGGLGRNPVFVNATLAAMERKGLVKQTGVWWRITPKGERVPPDAGDGTGSSPRARGGAPVKKSIDYGIVLEDLRRRRDELNAAIAAVERLEA